jgi:hypothetical protein
MNYNYEDEENTDKPAPISQVEFYNNTKEPNTTLTMENALYVNDAVSIALWLH